ncbi:MAG TPA: RNA polymerase sigma factor [Candidatus Tectomicrobia bacterium]|jgi:DNA-directed RNA polymerase specialized sigma24 family protein|nr:RNA polymerase sigma factor [Candidatus Tectomicrobia bacterium]
MTQTELTAAIVIHLDVLHNLAAWLTPDVVEAQALVQATCRQALRVMPQLLPGTNLRVSLLTIMWGLYRQRHGLHTDGLDDKAAIQATADKRMLFHTLSRTDLDAGLRELPEALRSALILTDVEGCALEEVAEVFGWSKPQAQVALAKARQLLDRFLQARLTTPTVLPTPEEKDSL